MSPEKSPIFTTNTAEYGQEHVPSGAGYAVAWESDARASIVGPQIRRTESYIAQEAISPPGAIDMTERVCDKYGIDPRSQMHILVPENENNSSRRQEISHVTAEDPKGYKRKFGISSPEEFSRFGADTKERFARPDAERSGTALEVSSGERRKPIMDIAITDNELKSVIANDIEQRSVGLDLALNTLGSLEGKTQAEKLAIYTEMTDRQDGALVRSGVWSRRYGDSLSANDTKERPRGTMADLYINSEDLKKYAQIDTALRSLKSEVAPESTAEFDSVSELTERVSGVAELTFPSGTELMHTSPRESFDHIARQGELATRSMASGDGVTQRKLQLNGGFVHLTPPGAAAEEYGDIMFGVPIDTVVKRSPYLQLEDTYANNRFSRDGQVWSTQELMAGLIINRPMDEAATPLVFRQALEAQQQAIAKGARPIDIGLGARDNLSFAVSGDAETAASYTYPLEEIHIYTDDPIQLDKLARKYPERADLLYKNSTTVAGYTNQALTEALHKPLREAALPNFALTNEPLKVYAPVSKREVSFTESTMRANQRPAESGRIMQPVAEQQTESRGSEEVRRLAAQAALEAFKQETSGLVF